MPEWLAINSEWEGIRQCYPLPKWDLAAATPDRAEGESLRLPRIQGQAWVIGQSSPNEYYRPPERLAQPASWGSGSLWGETLLPRLREITTYTAQWHDLQRLRAAQEAVGHWAHEVKNHTIPILSNMRASLRQMEPAAPAFEPARRALRAAVILNACSFAAQKILENRSSPAAQTRMLLLPEGRCEVIVEGTLQYLLQVWRLSSPEPLVLEWEPLLTERDALGLLAVALGKGGKEDGDTMDEALLTDQAVVGAVSLLREAVFNIRCDSPIDEPLVRVARRYSRAPRLLTLTLEQYQRERYPWSADPDPPKGLTRANRLYGPEGAQLGRIVSHPPAQTEIDGGVSIKYVVEVEFNLAS